MTVYIKPGVYSAGHVFEPIRHPVYIKVEDLLWVYNHNFVYQSNAEGRIAEIKQDYPHLKVFYASAQKPEELLKFTGWEVFVEFKDEGEEAEFLLRESVI